jgi:anti-sigma factor RsiW
MAVAVVALLIVTVGLWSVLEIIHQRQALAALDSEGRSAYLLYAGIPFDQWSERDVTAQSSAQLSTVVGSQVNPPDLKSLGLHLLRSGALKQENGPAVVLVYGDGNGRTISCYFERSGGAGKTSYAKSQAGAINAVYRIDDEIGYAVVGPFEPQVLRAVAELSYREIEE